MTSRKPQSRNTPDKQNIDCRKLQSTAKDKLHTFSEDLQQFVLDQSKQHFSGWLNDNVLVERVNKTRKRPSQEPFKLTANKIVLERRWKRNAQELDCKTGIILLKKECEYLQSEREEIEVMGAKLRTKFPKKQDIILRQSLQEVPYKVQNNFFCTRDRYSAMESNRKKIKGLKKRSLAHVDTNTSLRPNTTTQTISREFIGKRPFSSTQYQSERLEKAQITVTGCKPLSAFDIYNNKQIHAGFKRCRMHKRNRSARFSFAEPTTQSHISEHLIKVSKLDPKPKLSVAVILNS